MAHTVLWFTLETWGIWICLDFDFGVVKCPASCFKAVTQCSVVKCPASCFRALTQCSVIFLRAIISPRPIFRRLLFFSCSSNIEAIQKIWEWHWNKTVWTWWYVYFRIKGRRIQEHNYALWVFTGIRARFFAFYLRVSFIISVYWKDFSWKHITHIHSNSCI